MNEFVIRKMNSCEYDKFLLCLTFESIINYLDDIESSPEIKGQSGMLLIDQLLVTGDCENRFICCVYKDGKIDVSSTRKVIPTDEYRRKSVEELQSKFDCLKFSILSDEQKERILEGKIV